MASNCHPDDDTICAFRRNNFEAVAKAFEQVLLLAKELRGEIEAWLARAEQEHSAGASDPQAMPEELTRHERLREQLDRACAELERRPRVAAAKERVSYDRRVSEWERRSGRHKGARIKAPKEERDSKRHILQPVGLSGRLRFYNGEIVPDQESFDDEVCKA